MLDVEAQFPALSNAVQPPPLPFREGTFHYRPADVFADLVARAKAGTFRLRAPAPSTDGLIPFRGYGDCLTPLLHHDLYWADPTLEPADNDLVIVHLDPAELEGIVERGSKDPHWVAQYGLKPPPIATKLLKASGPNWWLQDRETAFQLGRNRIAGVVRKVMTVDGRFLYEDHDQDVIAVSQLIGANAVSQVVSATTAGQTSVGLSLSSATDTDMQTATITATGATVAVDASCNFDVFHTNGNTVATCLLTVRRDGSDVGTTQFDAAAALTNMGGTQWQGQVTLTVVDTPAAGSHTYTFHCHAAGAGTSGTPGFVYANPTLKVREYKK